MVQQARVDECCGFGGTFVTRHPDISDAIVSDKVAAVRDTGAERVVSADCGCLLNITSRRQAPRRARRAALRHLASSCATHRDAADAASGTD